MAPHKGIGGIKAVDVGLVDEVVEEEASGVEGTEQDDVG